MNVLETPIDYLKGVGPLRADLLKKELNIFTYVITLLDILIRVSFIKLKN